MKAAWKKIERHLEVHLPDVHAALRPPAEPRALSDAEAEIGVTFPERLRETLAIHDGMDSESLYDLFRLLSVAEVVEEWRSLVHLLDAGEFADCTTEHDKKVADGWFRRGWVPFAADGFGNLLCVDMEPGPRGKPGQVLCFWHDAAERKVESADLLSWMRRVARELPKAEIEPMPKPVVVSGQAFRNAVDAQKRAVRGDTDLAMEALRGFREQGDASAAAALSLLHAFRGEWSAVIELSSFVLAHSEAFHHVNVPREHCELLARAAVFTGRWSEVGHAATLLAPCHAGKASTKLAESASAGEDLLNVADLDESSPEENAEKYQRYLEQGVPSTYSATEQSRRRHHFLMAVRYRRIDVALRLIAEGEEVVELSDAVALAPFVPAEELWPITLASLQRWYPVYTAQVAPAELITTPVMRDIMTPERCELVLSTPRARHYWDFRRAAS